MQISRLAVDLISLGRFKVSVRVPSFTVRSQSLCFTTSVFSDTSLGRVICPRGPLSLARHLSC